MNSLGAPIYFRRDSDCPTKNTSATTERIHQGAVNDTAETLYLVFCYFECFAVDGQILSSRMLFSRGGQFSS